MITYDFNASINDIPETTGRTVKDVVEELIDVLKKTGYKGSVSISANANGKSSILLAGDGIYWSRPNSDSEYREDYLHGF